MRFVFKIIIVFLIVFNFRLPMVYNSVVVAILLTALDYLIIKKAIPFTYFFLRYNVVILIASVLLSLIILFFSLIHNTPLPQLDKRMAVMFMMLCALIFALPMLIEGKESTAFEEVATIICYAFALQGLIHLIGLLVPSVGDFLFEMKPEGLKERVNDPSEHIHRFRLYVLTGSVFFELPSAYGVACILFFRLQLIKGANYISGWKSYFVLFFLIAGIMLSGRTGFIGLGIGFGLFIIASFNSVFSFLLKHGWRLIIIALVLIIGFNVFLSPNQRKMISEEVFPFAFEAYYNWIDEGEFRTASTDVTNELFYYPLRDETLFAGHGLERDDIPLVGYRQTDAGYMRSIIFGGIFFLLCLIIYQCLYFIRPLSIARKGETEEDHNDFLCLLFLFLYIFILHYKDNALGTQHITETLFILIGSAYLIRYYFREESDELNELAE